MNVRMLKIACAASVAALCTGCSLYTNASACRQAMRDALAGHASGGTLTVDHTATALLGSRVVVEGSIKTAPAADGARNEPGAADVAATMPAGKTAAAAECTFKGEQLEAFRWLAPPQLAQTNAQQGTQTGP